MTDLAPLLDLVSRNTWPAVAVLVITLLARAAKEPAVGSVFARVPREHRPRVIAVLGAISGALEAVVRGTPWGKALVYGLISAGLALLVHGVAGGVSPEKAPTAPSAKGELPRPSTGDVEPAPVELPVPPELTPTPDRADAPAQPIVEPAERWGPMPRPSER